MGKLHRWASHGLWALFSLVFTAVLLLAVIYVYMELQLPNVETLRDVHLQVPLRIYSSDGKLIALYGAKRRIPIALNQVPQDLINAVLATEDARFYEHPGVDLVGIIRAAKAVISSGKRTQGASTITMQVARNFFLSRKKTYGRKINEILLALKIDRELSKDKVLELYLNKIYFGNRAYGVAAAADVYYGKTLSQLTLPEIAMIAGLPQAPSRNNPINNPEGALKRRDHVLSRMLELKFITEEQYKKAIVAPVTATYHVAHIQVQAPYLAEMVREAMLDEYGNSAYDKGLIIYTTLSSKTQKSAHRALRQGLIAFDQRHGYRKPKRNLGEFQEQHWISMLQQVPVIAGIQPAAVISVENRSVQALLASGKTITIPWSGLSWARPELENGYVGAYPEYAHQILNSGDVIEVKQLKNKEWRLTQIPQVEGAIVALNPKNGAVLALDGGFNYELSSFNRVTQAERQPGSNFKPFIYSAALNKEFTLASMINDAPIVMNDTGENELWRPVNDTKKFYGPTSLREALTKSRNLVSIRLLQAIGINYALDYVKRFGFDPNTLPRALSLALGSGTVTPMQIANGYSVFANGGSRVDPYFIDRIEDQLHHVLFQSKPLMACSVCIVNPNPPENELPSPMAPRVITPQNAYLITQVLRDVIRAGTGKRARALNRSDIAGKTGTTNDQVDAWFSGFNSNLEATVWVGFDNMKPLREYGARAALPIWMEFMEAALNHAPEATMPEPAGLVMVRIDPSTGLLAKPTEANARFEIFEKSNAPTTFSPNENGESVYSGTAGSNKKTDNSDSHSDPSDLF